MIKPSELTNEETINKAVQSRESEISNLRELLPYADGPSYYKDKDRIALLSKEVQQLKESL